MSTRSCIARQNTDSPDAERFGGVYHHWDGYPTELGKTLFRLYHGHFKRDLSAMLNFLIDQHPAGWCTINGCDFNKPAGYDSPGPQCFCHGERSEEAMPVDETSDAGMEWAYVFGEGLDANGATTRVMYVLERLYYSNAKHMVGMFGIGAPGNQYWEVAARIDLDGAEPDWSKITAEKPKDIHA